jgi:hypothetical protein
MTELYQTFQTHIKNLNIPDDDKNNSNLILNTNDISLTNALPDDNLFNLNSNKLLIKDRSLIKSHFKIKNNEKFYKSGLLKNMFFTQPDLFNNELDTDYDNLKLVKYFSTKICDYNWLLSFNIFLHYTNTTKHSFDFVKNNEIRLLNLGNGKGDFISGMYYYFTNSNISKNTRVAKHLKHCDIKWIGIDINNTDTNIYFRKLVRLLSTNIDKDTYHIIHGFLNDDILEYKNLMYVKTMIDNKMDSINVLYNNIKPRMTNKKNKILLSVAILSVYSLSNAGLMVTKILEPEYWDGEFINYLVLFALIFNKTEIFRFPVSKNNKTYFRYYLSGCCKKNVIHNKHIGRKLMYILQNYIIEQPKLLSSIIDCEEIIEWRKKILDIQKMYIETTETPITQLHTNINQLKDII